MAEEEIHRMPKIDIFFKDRSRRETGNGKSGDKMNQNNKILIQLLSL